MVIISYAPLRDFTQAHPAIGDALEKWYGICKAANWKSITDVRLSFNDVDYVGNDRYVFNIKGNHYRLVAMIFFNRRTLYVRFVGSHRQYDAIDVTTI